MYMQVPDGCRHPYKHVLAVIVFASNIWLSMYLQLRGSCYKYVVALASTRLLLVYSSRCRHFFWSHACCICTCKQQMAVGVLVSKREFLQARVRCGYTRKCVLVDNMHARTRAVDVLSTRARARCDRTCKYEVIVAVLALSFARSLKSRGQVQRE